MGVCAPEGWMKERREEGRSGCPGGLHVILCRDEGKKKMRKEKQCHKAWTWSTLHLSFLRSLFSATDRPTCVVGWSVPTSTEQAEPRMCFLQFGRSGRQKESRGSGGVGEKEGGGGQQGRAGGGRYQKYRPVASLCYCVPTGECKSKCQGPGSSPPGERKKEGKKISVWCLTIQGSKLQPSAPSRRDGILLGNVDPPGRWRQGGGLDGSCPGQVGSHWGLRREVPWSGAARLLGSAIWASSPPLNLLLFA